MDTRTRKEDNAAELNLLPVMNLVTILIPLLLMSAQLVQLAVIDSTLPAISEQIAPPEPTPTQEPFRLSLAISGEGFTLMGADEVLGEDNNTIPCVDGACATRDSYDFAGLTSKLAEVKGAHPDESVIILVPDVRVPYEVLVAAMDAAREDSGGLLFPNVTIAGGLSG